MPTLREIMLLQELQHENVIELIEVFVHNCNINLVFEFCSADLEHIVKTKTLPLDGPRIKGYMLGTLRGLAHCHRTGCSTATSSRATFSFHQLAASRSPTLASRAFSAARTASTPGRW